MFAETVDPPDVYRTPAEIRGRPVLYALGPRAQLLDYHRPEPDETDEEVVARLIALLNDVRDEPRLPALALVNADTIIAHGFSPSFHRPLSLPRLVQETPQEMPREA
jgi:hypothetical protein